VRPIFTDLPIENPLSDRSYVDDVAVFPQVQVTSPAVMMAYLIIILIFCVMVECTLEP
jgi:hypothetical protein